MGQGCENGGRSQQHLDDWGTSAVQNRRIQRRQLAAVLESIKGDTSTHRRKRAPSAYGRGLAIRKTVFPLRSTAESRFLGVNTGQTRQ